MSHLFFSCFHLKPSWEEKFYSYEIKCFLGSFENVKDAYVCVCVYICGVGWKIRWLKNSWAEIFLWWFHICCWWLVDQSDVSTATLMEEIDGWLLAWILWHINLCRLFNAKSNFKQIINSISNKSVKYEDTVYMYKNISFASYSVYSNSSNSANSV